MQRFMIVFVILVGSVLSGCVFMDIACQDTAVPMYPQRVNTSVSFSQGVNIADTYYEEAEEEADPNHVRTTFVKCGKVAVGVSPKADVIMNFSGSRERSHLSWGDDQSTRFYESSQKELGMKYLIRQEGKTYLSILPSVYYAEGKDTEKGSFDDNHNYKYSVWGIEGQLLYTHKASENACATLVARAQINNIKKNLDGENYGTSTTANFGIRGNFRISVNAFYIIPEFGFEVLPITGGSVVTLPIMSIGLGIQL